MFFAKSLVGAVAALSACAACAAAHKNLAAGKACEFSDPPNYGYCNDADDARQLTDGEMRMSTGKGTGYLWIDKSCVGWCRKTGVRSISVDLGSSQPIGGFACNMAAGVAGVTWPKSIKVYVGEKRGEWRYAGDLWAKSVAATGAPRPDAYSVYCVACEDMPCLGRHVLFLFEQEPFTFVDEIEVFPAKAGVKPLDGPLISDPRDHHFAELVRRHVRADARRIRSAAESLSEVDRAAVMGRLVNGLKKSKSFAVADYRSFETPIPLCAAHEDVFAANAVLMRAAGITSPTLWDKCRWENLDPLEVPSAEARGNAPLRLEMMRGERRAVAVCVANPSDSPLVCKVSAVGFAAEAHPELAEVMFTETPALKCVSSALRFVPEGSALEFSLLAGTSKQVWLSFAKPTLRTGVHRGALAFSLSDGTKLERGVEIVMHDFDMPVRPRLHLGGWDYSDCHVKDPDKFKPIREQMRRVLADTPFATNRVLPGNPVFREDGTLANVDKLDHSWWDKWISLWPDARQFAVFVNPPHREFFGEKVGTPRFEKMVGEYYRAFYAHAKATGIGDRRIVLHLIDEPALPSLPSVIVAWEKAIKKGCPALSVMENPTFAKPEEVPQEMFDRADVLCPQMWEMHKGGNVPFYAARAQKGQETWVYSCNGPSRDLSPVSYYIAQAYLAFQMGACGSAFWQFGDGGSSIGSWHAYSQQHNESSPYFAAPWRAMPAKQGEAVLESVYDFEYMSMLAEMIKAAKSAGRDVAAAECVLAEAPRRVLGQGLSGGEDLKLVESERWNEFKRHDASEVSRAAVLRAMSGIKANPFADRLADGFENVPTANRPWCYWWWLNGHADRETITADIEAMKRLGFGGLLMFDSRGYWEDDDHLRMARPEVVWGSNEWYDLVEFSIRECARLGLDFTMNASASGGKLNGFRDGKEYEVDVLNRAEVLEHLDRVLCPVLKRVPDLVGKTFTHIYSVSYEGSIRSGGRCRDIKASLYDTMREWAHGHGLMVYSESGGPWSRKPDRFGECDQIDFYAANDMPQGEFWYREAGKPSPLPFLRGAVAAAHLYGRTRVSAEAFTHMMQHWSVVPSGLKRCGDDAFIDGVNHFVWHTFTCSPPKFGVPGHEYFAGTHINRNVTWHGEAGEFVKYLGRCQWMLQQGTPVVDFAVWVGDSAYQGWGRHRNRPYEGSGLVLPKNASYDMMDTRVLLGRTSAKGGTILLAGGMSYAALILDPALESDETPEVMSKIAELRGSGARVLDCKDASAFFSAHVPDFASPGDFSAVHRRTAEEDIYFITGEGNCDCSFRISRGRAELWNPVTGKRCDAEMRIAQDGRRVVRLNLPRDGSVFVVFRDGRCSVAEHKPHHAAKGRPIRIVGPWRASFSYHPGIASPPPAPREMSLGDFSASRDFDVAHFSGTVSYKAAFRCEHGETGERTLSLGDVRGGLVRVLLNGCDLGVVWTAPWEVHVPESALRTGENVLEVRFVNAWANRLIGDCKLPKDRRITSSNLAYRRGSRKDGIPPECSGYVSDEPLFLNGLYGPVELR